MNSTPLISVGAFDVSIPTPLTNEIPHLSIYNILNKQLRNVWSQDFIGRSNTDYSHAFGSQKIVNGEQSKVYTARTLQFSDPDSGEVYRADFEKINFSVDGALETEIDYLMHENARYLSKLYPDDVNTLYTLTEAERQSYLNEAGHMIHSYFDTEQIVTSGLDGINKSLADLYFRVKFLTGITSVRSLTGVAKQEEQLLNLLNTGNTTTYSGFSIFSSANQEYVISNAKSYEPSAGAFSLDAFYFMNAQTYKKKGAVKLHGKTRNDSLEDLLRNVATYVNVTPETLEVNIKDFTVLDTNDPLEILEDMIYGNGKFLSEFNLNDYFFKATRENWIKAGATLESLQATPYGDKVLDWKSTEIVYPLFSQENGIRELAFFKKADSSMINPIELENKIITNTQATLKDFEKSYIIKLGYSQYKNDVMLALGNIIYSDLSYRYNLYEEFSLTLDTVCASKDLVLTVDVKKNGKRVFSGILDSNFLKERNLSKIVSNYSIQEFDEIYNANSLFRKKSLQTRLEEFVFSTRDELKIEYKSAKFIDENYVDEVICIEDTIGDKDYTILLTQHSDLTYSILLNYQEQVGEELTVRGIEGNSASGSLVDAGDAATKRGSFSYIDNKLTIVLDGIGSAEFTVDTCYDEKHIYVYKSSGEKVGQYATGFTKSKETGLNREAFVDIDWIPKIVETTKVQKLFGHLINTRFEMSFVVQHNDTFLDWESNIYSNVTELPIEYFETFEDALNRNTITYTNVVYDSTSSADVYVYCTAYKIETLRYAIPSSPLNRADLSRILFLERLPDFFELKTCKCEIYSSNILRMSDDIRDDVNKYGRINCLLLNTYGDFHATRVVDAIVKNEYCYATLEEDIDNYDTITEKDAILILDLKQKADVIISKGLDAIKRVYENTQTFKFKEGLKYYRSVDWEDLSRKHLSYAFNNLFSKNAETIYADNSKLSKATLVPQSLSYLENLTVLDSSISTELFKDLIEENRSLYLDSSVKILTNVALENKMLVYTTDYDCISYMYSTVLPSTITFYDYSNYNEYEPLKDFLEEIGQNPIDLEDLQKQISRRMVIWGDVIWDANNVKSVKTLRTIWSGYFTNFKIINTDDILPSEPIVLSDLGVTAEQKKKTINICNYNFAANTGDATSDWIISTIIDTSKSERVRVNICDAFSHETLEDKTDSVSKTSNTDIYLDSFALRANRMDYNVSDDSTVWKTCDAYVSKIKFDANLEIRPLDENHKLIVDYDTYDNSYTFTTSKNPVEYINYKPDTKYSLNLVYNMLHLDEENFEALGYFDTFISSVALQMFLEHSIYIYYVNHCTDTSNATDVRNGILKTNINLQDKIVDFYRQLLFDGGAVLDSFVETGKVIKISDVLNYVCELYASVDCIPCIGKLNKSGKLDLYYYLIGRTEENTFYIYEGTTRETVNGDLLNSILNRICKGFQVAKSIYQMYLTTIYKYQTILPKKAEGLPTNLSIDTYFEMSPVSQDIKISSEVTDPAMLASKKKFLEDNSEKHIETVLKNDILNVFPKFQLSDIALEEDSVWIGKNKYRLADAAKYFKEYYTATVQLSTELEESSTDIDKCIIQFDQDFGLKKKGYVYLTDIKAPNKRTSYATSRETQILDRSCTLQNLHIIGFKEEDSQLKLLLQDSSATYTRFVENAMSLIQPQNDSEHTQKVSDKNLSLGFKWTDPGLEIGYTFYKRKFIFEGEVSAEDPTIIKLVDENLKQVKEENNFSFNDHVTAGDSVQIIINEATSKYQAGQVISLNLTQSGFYGPYKIIYSKALAIAEGSFQFVVLSGPGNLVVAKIPLDTNSEIWISEPSVFDTEHRYVAYALSTGEIVYYNPNTNATYKIAEIPAFEMHEPWITIDDPITEVTRSVSASFLPNNLECEETDKTCKVIIANKVSNENLYEESLTATHKDWYVFGEVPNTTSNDNTGDLPGGDLDTSTLPFGEMILESSATQVLSSIPLNDGFLNIDNFDRMFFETSTGEETTTWLAIPDKLEEFDTSEQPGCYIESTEDGDTTIDIETATTEELIKIIRNTLNDMFSNSSTFDESIDSTALNYNFESKVDENGYPIGLDEAQLAELSKLAQSKDGSFKLYHGSTSDMANSALARMFSHIERGSANTEWKPLTDNVYVPVLEEMDIPVYFKKDEKPKWKKAYVITGLGFSTLETANTDELVKLAKALLPSRFVARDTPNITAYVREKDNLVLWDQDSATLTVTDKSGLLKNRIALKSLVVEHPMLSDRVVDTNKGNPVSYAHSNLLFSYAAKSDVYGYWNAMTTSKPIEYDGKTYNVYSIFGLEIAENGTISYNSTAPLYLPTVLASYRDYEEDDWFTEFGADGTAIGKLVEIATSETNFQNWINSCLHLDFMTTAICKFEAFKDNSYTLNLPLLSTLCNKFSALAVQAGLITEILEFITETLDAKIVKGQPYYTVDTEGQSQFVAARLTAMATNSLATKAFESLITSSGIDVTESHIHVYGIINWPDLNSVETRVKDILNNNYASVLQDVGPDVLNSIIAEIANTITAQLRENYAKFNGTREYKAGDSSFKVTVDLNSGKIKTVQLNTELIEGKQAKFLSISNSGTSRIVIASDGAFELGDAENDVLSVDPDNATKFTDDASITPDSAVIVYDALKTAGLFSTVTVNENRSLEIVTKGTAITNPETVYSTIAHVTDKEIGIRNDAIALENGTSAIVTVLVANGTKDNFQLGYGKVTYLDRVYANHTVFEVPSAYNADFATYDNSASLRVFNENTGGYHKPSVFDLYPTFEKVNDSLKDKFYKLDDDKNVKYLKNGNNRFILRVTDPESVTIGNRFVGNVKPQDFATITDATDRTVANEWIDLDFLKDVGADKVNTVLLPGKRTYGKDYESLVNTYSLQRVPELVDDPWSAILQHPYRISVLESKVADGSVEIKEGYLEVTLTESEAIDFADFIDSIKPELKLDSRIEEANKVQLENISNTFTPLDVNVEVSKIDLSIINPTETLPRLVPITKYPSSLDLDKNLIIKTTSNELYIPEKGYGQTLLGNYTLPQDCRFEDGIFFNESLKTLNSSNEQFILVDKFGEPLKDSEGNNVTVPKLVYKSFAQANQVLSIDLATKESLNLSDTLIDLTKFDLGYNSVQCNQLHLLELLDFTGKFGKVTAAANEKALGVYELFKNKLKFSCKFLYSESPKDPTTENVICLSDCYTENYTNTQLIESLGYTRSYSGLQIPANTRYLSRSGAYKLTNTLLARNLNAYSAGIDGKLLYLDIDGRITATPTVNKDPICAVKKSQNIALFTVVNGAINALVSNCFYYTKHSISPNDTSNMLIVKATDDGLGSILEICDPNEAPATYSNIQNITSDTDRWMSDTSFKFVFDKAAVKDLQVELVYEKTYKNSSFNMVYLRDINGDLVAKVFFRKPVDSDSLLIFQKNS